MTTRKYQEAIDSIKATKDDGREVKQRRPPIKPVKRRNADSDEVERVEQLQRKRPRLGEKQTAHDTEDEDENHPNDGEQYMFFF